uniref:Uncharacterized protein n=1 Tax=Rhizophora mucronata TaxID=61149 RepID=A0A2P2N3E6_RHIMU
MEMVKSRAEEGLLSASDFPCFQFIVSDESTNFL